MLTRASARILMLFCAVWVAHAQGPVKVVLSGTGYNFGSAEEPTKPDAAAAVARQVIGEKLPFWFGPQAKALFRVTLEINAHPEQSTISLQIFYDNEARHGADGKDLWRGSLIKEDTFENGRLPLTAVPRGTGAWNDPIKYSLLELLGSNQKSIESAMKQIPIGTEVTGVSAQIPAQSKTFFPRLKFQWAKDSPPLGHFFVMHLQAADGDHGLKVVGLDLACADPATTNCPVKVVMVRPEGFFSSLSFNLDEYQDLLENKTPWIGVKWKEFYWCRSNLGPQVE